jgi:hypothetical protein
MVVRDEARIVEIANGYLDKLELWVILFKTGRKIMAVMLPETKVIYHQEDASPNHEIPPLVAGFDLEDASPYGLQGLSRGKLSVLKPDCVTSLAITLALQGSRKQIRDPGFVAEVLKQNPGWQQEFQIVHLIEKSLWIQGRSDLVMSMLKNPSFIPDNPPDTVTQTLINAYFKHSHATVWYGVPLFGEEKTPSGLPIPLSAQEVKSEAERRIKIAQQHALRWGWLYQSLAAGAAIPALILQGFVNTGTSISNKYTGLKQWIVRLRKNARRKQRRKLLNQFQYCRYGTENFINPYQDMSDTDKFVLDAIEATSIAAMNAAGLTGQLTLYTAPLGATGWGVYFTYISLYIPLTMIPIDPFLFIELKDEPGKLRHLAHWYWQEHANGKRTLHLHL